MPLFNGSIVTKKLRNTIDIFFGKTLKNKQRTVCSYHVTYALQGESTLYSCLNVKELLA